MPTVPAAASSRRVKDALYPQLARIGKAVSSPHRLELLHLLSHGEKPVETLAAQARLSVKNASAHLRVLREARLVQSRKAGQQVFYQLAEPGVARFVLSLRDLAERRLAEVRELSEHYFGGRKQMTPVDRRQLLSRIRNGEVTVLDLRDQAEFAAGHIPGARSVPMQELRKTLRSIPRDQEVVAYCHGPYCVLSLDAVELLTAKGYRATRLEDSVVEWAAAGLPVERAR
jgi:rhodanese-related sulfurtransferase/DNA-binding transcriptional ArsR family regulator